MSMTGKDCIAAALERRPTDRLPVYEHFWGDTEGEWKKAGLLGEEEILRNRYHLDMRHAGWLNTVADLDFEPQILEQTEDWEIILDGNGARLKRHRKHNATPEHIGFTVDEAEPWEETVKPHLQEVDRRRIPFEVYREQRALAVERDEFLCFAYLGPFEQMHPVCGHENMLMGMVEDPDWIADMVDTFVSFTIRHAETLFAEEGQPDGVWFYEDMGFKGKPFMSPAHYRTLIQPGHKRLFDWAHGKGMKVIVHSCGFVDALVPGMIEAGMDCLQAIEVKAGMNLPDLAARFGDQIAFCGGYDVRALISNDRATVDAEFDRAVRPLLETGRSWIMHSDHSIPPEVHPETLHYFHQRGQELFATIHG